MRDEEISAVNLAEWQRSQQRELDVVSRMLENQAALERGEGVGLIIRADGSFSVEAPGPMKVRRITDDPDSVTIPLTFERLTIEDARAGQISVGGNFTDGDGMTVTLDAPTKRRAPDETLAQIEALAMKFMCDVREALDAASKPPPEDASVHSAIAAMQRPGRAHEL